MAIPMAASFSNLIPVSGHVKLDKYLLNRCYMTSMEIPSLKSSKISKRFFHDTGKFLYRSYKRGIVIKQQRHCQRALSGDESNDSSITPEEEKEDVSKQTLILRAIKLPIYSVALVPLTVGSAAAYLQTGVFYAKRYFVLLFSSVLVITWLNLSNDVYDSDTGADKNKRESVVSLVGSRNGTLIAAVSSLALGLRGLAWASVQASNSRSILLLACAIACGFVYQCPPFRLSYLGLGEPLCFVAFGPLATAAFYLMQGGSSVVNHVPVTGTVLSASILVGLTTTLILFCSHFHQIEDDKSVGKMSPLVRLGTETGYMVVEIALMALYLLLLLFDRSNMLPPACVITCGLTAPMGKWVVDYVYENHKDKEKIFMAKYYAVRLHVLFGAALAAGLVLTRKIGSIF